MFRWFNHTRFIFSTLADEEKLQILAGVRSTAPLPSESRYGSGID